jgi:hypothetical protein
MSVRISAGSKLMCFLHFVLIYVRCFHVPLKIHLPQVEDDWSNSLLHHYTRIQSYARFSVQQYHTVTSCHFYPFFHWPLGLGDSIESHTHFLPSRCIYKCNTNNLTRLIISAFGADMLNSWVCRNDFFWHGHVASILKAENQDIFIKTTGFLHWSAFQLHNLFLM